MTNQEEAPTNRVRVQMEVAFETGHFEPLEDPYTGSSKVEVTDEEPDARTGGLSERFARAVAETTIHPGDTFRIRRLENQHVESRSEGA